jgi:hypothetical protein
MIKAQIENNTVINIIAVDPINIPDWCYDWPTATENTEIGGTYANGVFTRIPRLPVEEGPAPVPTSISFAQLLIGLVTEQWITEAEGEAWLAGTLPTTVLTVIESLPQEQRFAAKARALRPSEVLRSDPLVASMAIAAGHTEEEIDTFFQTYAGV